METVYDWVSVFLFAGLIVLFVHRATSEEDDTAPAQSVAPYLVGGIGCAIGNYFGNQGIASLAVLILGATILYIVYYLRPFPGWPR